MSKETVIDVQPKRAAAILKKFVNEHCEGNFKWFKSTGTEYVSILDVLAAINILEKQEGKITTVVSDE